MCVHVWCDMVCDVVSVGVMWCGVSMCPCVVCVCKLQWKEGGEGGGGGGHGARYKLILNYKLI